MFFPPNMSFAYAYTRPCTHDLVFSWVTWPFLVDWYTFARRVWFYSKVLSMLNWTGIQEFVCFETFLYRVHFVCYPPISVTEVKHMYRVTISPSLVASARTFHKLLMQQSKLHHSLQIQYSVKMLKWPKILFLRLCNFEQKKHYEKICTLHHKTGKMPIACIAYLHCVDNDLCTAIHGSERSLNYQIQEGVGRCTNIPSSKTVFRWEFWILIPRIFQIWTLCQSFRRVFEQFPHRYFRSNIYPPLPPVLPSNSAYTGSKNCSR